MVTYYLSTFIGPSFPFGLPAARRFRLPSCLTVGCCVLAPAAGQDDHMKLYGDLNMNKPHRTARLSSAALALALILAAPAGAQTTTQVNNWDGLNQALTNASAGDTISFGPDPAGAITAGNGLQTYKENLTLDGNGWVLDLNGYWLRFHAGLASLTGLTMVGGSNAIYGGGAVSVNGNLNGSLADSAFVGNSSSIGPGGAVYVYGNLNGNLNGGLANSAFVGNSSVISGGAVYVDEDIIGDIDAAVFAGNHGDEGGGGAVCAGSLTGLIIGSTFVNNSIGSGQGGAIWLKSGLVLMAAPGHNTLFAGNTAYALPNSIHLELPKDVSGFLSVQTAAGGVVDMRDPFTITVRDSSSNATVGASLAGGGVWKLGGTSRVTNSGSGLIAFTASSGTLDLYGQGGASIGLDADGSPVIMEAGAINLGSTNSNFTLRSEATLIARGGNAIKAATIYFEAGATLGFDLLGYNGSDPLLDLDGTTVDVLTGKVDLLSLGSGTTNFTLAQGGNFTGFASSPVLTLRGEDINQTRANGLVTLSASGNQLTADIDTSTWSSQPVTWNGSGDDMTWNATTESWTNDNNNASTKFLHGDQVTFDGSGQGTIKINDGGVLASQVFFTGGDYSFTGGGITIAPASGGSGGSYEGLKLKDGDVRVDFTGQTGVNDFSRSGVTLEAGTLVIANEWQLGAALSKLSFSTSGDGILEIDGRAVFASAGGLEQRLRLGDNENGTIKLLDGATMLIAGNVGQFPSSLNPFGAGIQVDSGSTLIQKAGDGARLALYGNETETSGGGLYVGQSAKVTLTNADFIGNKASNLGGAAYLAERGKLFLEVGENQTSRFSGNKDSLNAVARSNSIYFEEGAALTVNVASGGLLSMTDAMHGDAASGLAINIAKEGQGRWQLDGNNYFVTDGAAGSEANFKVNGGALELAAETEISLGGAQSTFTVSSGARLDVAGKATVTSALVNLEPNTTLGFNLAAQTGGSTTPLLTLNAGSSGVGGNLTVDLMSAPQTQNTAYLLATGFDFNDPGIGYTLTMLGQSLAGTRGDGAYELTYDTSNLWVEQTRPVGNYVLTWTNGAGSNLWSLADENWTENNVDPEKYYAGDAVIFTADEAGTVTIDAGGAEVASMTVDGGEYTFIGGSLKGLTPGPGSDFLGLSSHRGQLSISGGGATFHNQAYFQGGVEVTGGYLALGRTATLQTGRVTINSGGTYKIGHGGIIDGDLTLLSGSILDIVDDLALTVTGTASLSAGLSPRMSYDTWTSGNTVTLMTAGSLTGNTFISQELNVAAFKGRLYTDSVTKTLNLEVIETRDPVTAIGGTFNQRSVVGAVDGLDKNHRLKNILTLPTTAETKKAADLLSGEGHSSTAGAILGQARTRGAQVARRVADLYIPSLDRAPATGSEDNPAAVWVSVGGRRTTLDGGAGLAKTRLTGPEAALGLDARFSDGWLAGASFGYAGLEAEVESRRYEADVDAYGLSAYFGRELAGGGGRWRFLAGGNYTRYDLDSQRTAAFPGFHERLKADYSANSVTFFGEGAYAFPVGERTALEPYLNLSWTRLSVGGWREKGGSAALEGQAETYRGTDTLLGLRTYVQAGEGLDLRLNLGWQHAFGDIDAQGAHAFRDGADQFRVQGVSASRNAALAGLGLSVNLTEGLNLTVDYDGLFGNDSQSHSGTARLIWNW